MRRGLAAFRLRAGGRIAFFVLPGLAFGQHEPANIEMGRALFSANCASCHGGDGRNGRAPDLTTGHFRAGQKETDLYLVIAHGIPGTDMPAWFGQLKESDIRRITAYLLAPRNDAPKPEITGNAANGEALFWGHGRCGACHAVRGKGNRIGPDLSNVGQQRSVAYIREALTREGPGLLPEFEGVTVVTRDGRSISGIIKALDDFSVVMIDFNGKVYSFDRAGVKSVTRETGSLMPSYARMLSETERDDLVAWLAK